MIRLFPYMLLIGFLFAVGKEGKAKTKFTVTGIVIGKDGEGIKKVKLTIYDENGKKIDSGKTNVDGEFKFKKMSAGKYRIIGEHKREGEVEHGFSITRKDIDFKLKFGKGIRNELLEIISPNKELAKTNKKFGNLNSIVVNSDDQRINGYFELSKGDGSIIVKERFAGTIRLVGIEQGYYRLVMSTDKNGPYETVVHLNENIDMGKIVLK